MLENSSTEVQQTKLFGVITNGDGARVVNWSTELLKIYGGKSISNKCLEFLRQVTLVSEDLIVIGSQFHVVDAATEILLGTKTCLELDDLRILDS